MGLSNEEALDCFASDDLIGIGMEADTVRRGLHPEGVVSYEVDRAVDVGRSSDEVYGKLHGAVRDGATTVTLTQGGTVPLTVEQLSAMLIEVRRRFPTLRFHALSAKEVLALATKASIRVSEVVTRLYGAGLDSLAAGTCSFEGGPEDFGLDAWLEINRLAHEAGLRSSVRMLFGAGEDVSQRVQALASIRELQQETGGFTSFTPWSFRPVDGGDGREEPTAVEYLRTLAISRMLLDNVENIESNCVTQGLKVTQMGLRFGANDTGSIRPEKASRIDFTEEDVRRVIRDAGFKPVERDASYQTMFLNN